MRNHESSQSKRQQGYYRCRNHIWAKQSFKTHSRRTHCYNLGIVRKLGCKENYGNKHEQGAEKVCQIRNEIHVIIKNNLAPFGIRGRKLIYLFVKVKYRRYSHNQGYRKEIRPQEFLYYITVYSPDERHASFLSVAFTLEYFSQERKRPDNNIFSCTNFHNRRIMVSITDDFQSV